MIEHINLELSGNDKKMINWPKWQSLNTVTAATTPTYTAATTTTTTNVIIVHRFFNFWPIRIASDSYEEI